MLQGGKGDRDSFSSKFGVLAALAGSAIGLGNIWRFPYVVGQNGGGAFLLIYVIFIAAIGIPVMMSEFVIGRSAQLNPVGAFKKIAPGNEVASGWNAGSCFSIYHLRFLYGCCWLDTGIRGPVCKVDSYFPKSLDLHPWTMQP